jgi:hypothetical protein
MATSIRSAIDEAIVPYVPSDADELDGCPPFPFPNVGNLVPDGWENVGQRWCVRKARHGGGDDAAMDCDEFRRSLRGYILRHPGHGFAITEDDDHWVVVSAFRRVEE